MHKKCFFLDDTNAKIFVNKLIFQVTIQFNTNAASPSEMVFLNVTANPGSLVNILAVDKSILLLRTANDITTTDVIIYYFVIAIARHLCKNKKEFFKETS